MKQKLSKIKAAELLKNPPHGNSLTNKQQVYFQSVVDGTNTYKDGGWLDKYADGGNLWNTNKKAFVDSTLQANKNLDFVDRLFHGTKSIPDPYDPKYKSTHLMSDSGNRSYPEIVNINGKLVHLSGDKAWDYADSTKEYIQFKTPEQASWFSSSTSPASGYKMGTGVLNDINSKTGVPYHSNEYKDGGKMQEYQPNFNNSSISLPKDYVGIGYNTKGRNYSPAWGGQFEEGGQLKKLDQLQNFNTFGESKKNWLSQYNK